MATSQRAILFTHFLLLCLCSSLILGFEYLDFTDYYNHLAQMFIFTNYEHLSHLNKYYDIHLYPSPYLGMDFFFLFFSKFLDVFQTGKLLIVTSFVIITFGVLLLNYQIHKRITASSLLFYPFLFNMNLSMGFLNYYFSIGFILIGFACYLKFEQKPKSQFVFCFFYSCLLFFLHLFALIIFMLICGIYELEKNKESIFKNYRKILFAGLKLIACCVIPLAILFAFSAQSYSQNMSITQFRLGDLFITFNSPLWYFTGINSMLLLFCIISLCISSFKFTKLKFTLAALYLLSFAIPSIVNGVGYVNTRLPAVVMFLFFASVSFNANFNKHLLRISCAVYFAVCGLFFYTLADDFSKRNNAVSQFTEAEKFIPEGSKVITIYNGGNAYVSHLYAKAAIDREAFVPTLFNAVPPLKIKNEHKDLAWTCCLVNYLTPKYAFKTDNEINALVEASAKQGRDKSYVYWSNWRQNYDYLLWFKFGDESIKAPDYLTSVYKDSFLEVYKISKP